MISLDKQGVTTRAVHFRIDPALRAYSEWVDATDQEFNLNAFDLFAAGYRARDAEDAARQQAGSSGDGDA